MAIRKVVFVSLQLFATLLVWFQRERILADSTYTFPNVRKIQGDVFLHQEARRQPDLAADGQVLHSGDKVITAWGARAKVYFNEHKTSELAEASEMLILDASETECGPIWKLISGKLAFFGIRSGGSSRCRFETPTINGGALNTEFELQVSQDGEETSIFVYDGEVEVANTESSVTLSSMQGAIVRKTGPVDPFSINVTNSVQWWLYYPAILDPDELQWTDSERRQLSASLDAWRLGDLRGALREFKSSAPDSSLTVGAYQRALNLAAGGSNATSRLAWLPVGSPVIDAHRLLLGAVTEPKETIIWLNSINQFTNSATWLLGRSFVYQANLDLKAALHDAERAVHLAPRHGLAWSRLADLQFSHGNLGPAKKALAQALQISPSSSPAHTLNGFILAGENRMDEAGAEFKNAIRLDPLLPDPWLGLGLLDFRKGDKVNGLRLIREATALQVNRSLLHSYLGKAYSENNDSARAVFVFDRAKALDREDPTPWLYSALHLYSKNQANDAIRELEESLSKNDNRAVYRSQLLLGEDRAVRATSLARLYQRAGLDEPAYREAIRAVDDDFLNPAAHLFLADSYNAMRDPTRFNLRNESAWFNELLLANILSPVDAGVLSPSLSQQEYTRLFASEGMRLSSFGEARSDGQYRQVATQSGVWKRTAYALDLDWQHNDGVRVNNDLDRTEIYSQIKHQVTSQDTAMLMLKFESFESGDNFQHTNHNEVRPLYRFKERQRPISIGMWRHDWSPTMRTLILAGRIENEQWVKDQDFEVAQVYELGLNGGFDPSRLNDFALSGGSRYHGSMSGYTAEVSQIAQYADHRIIAGGRFQTGGVETRSTLTGVFDGPEILGSTPLDAPNKFNYSDDTGFSRFQRSVIYLYENWRPWKSLSLVGGLTWDALEGPANFRNPPIRPANLDRSVWLPKLAVIWRAADSVTFRAMGSESIGGISLEDSYRLEPAQLAGFSQFNRTVIPESLVGSVSGHSLDVIGVAMDVKLLSSTYLGVELRHTTSKVNDRIGIFGNQTWDTPVIVPMDMERRLNYAENSAILTAHQLVGPYLALGVGCSYTRSELNREFPDIYVASGQVADLLSSRVQATINAPNGIFVRGICSAWWQIAAEDGRIGTGLWNHSSHSTVDLESGFRFRNQRGELSIGVLNLLGENYQFDPLSAIPDLPRERVFLIRLRLNM